MTTSTTKPELKVVGEIKPPPYKEPVQMLKNILKEIEEGNLELSSIALVYWGDEVPLTIFGGGKNSSMADVAFLFGAAHQRLLGCSAEVYE